MNIEQLKQEAEQLRLQGNESGYIAKMREIEELQAQSQIEKSSVVSDAPFIFTASGQTINLRDFNMDEATYQALSIALSQWMYEQEQDKQNDIESLTALKDEQINQYKSQIEAAQATAEREMSLQIEAMEQMKLFNKDLESKLAAAAQEADDLRIRVKELEAIQAPPKKPTNMDGAALAEAMKKVNDAKPRIYAKKSGDMATTFYIAKLVETDEEIHIPHLQIGRYVELVKDEEVAAFRQELAKAKEEADRLAGDVPELVEEGVENTGVPIPQTFQDEAGVSEPRDEAVQDLHVESDNGGVESLEARMTEAERRIAELEFQFSKQLNSVA